MITQECIDKIRNNIDYDISKLANGLATSMKYGVCYSKYKELYVKTVYKNILDCYNVFDEMPEKFWKLSSSGSYQIVTTGMIIHINGTLEEIYKLIIKYKYLYPDSKLFCSYDGEFLYIWATVNTITLSKEYVNIDSEPYNLELYIEAIEAMNCYTHDKIRNLITNLNY